MDIAEFAPGELYTDQYKVKVNDLVFRIFLKIFFWENLDFFLKSVSTTQGIRDLFA